MFKRNRCLRLLAAIASISSLATGCGLVSDAASDDRRPIVVGTTSAPSTLDPAASWDGSWELFRNVYQTLLSYPNGATFPQPDAAESCTFTDTSKRTYSCRLRRGLTFSDGHALNAQAVKYSIDRIKKINVKGGPVGLLGSLNRVEARGDHEVVFHLSRSDATFPFVLATPAMSIVDMAEYPANATRAGAGVLGSGPYRLESYQDGKEAELVRNDRYKGLAKRRNDRLTIRYFPDSDAMVKALRDKQIDVTYRGLDADDIVALQKGRSQKEWDLIEGTGADINYLVFNPKDRWAGRPAVRRAVAQIIDRAAIAHFVYRDTVEPLYSMVPKGLTGHTSGYFDDFGDPDTAKARKILAAAGIKKPVPLTLWYASDRYGSKTAAQFEELKRQLEQSGLFRITLNSRPWKAYVRGYQRGEYPVFGRGWYPDFPDADNFIAPFVGEQNALGTPYPLPEVTGTLLPRSRRESDRARAEQDLEDTQRILVRDSRLLPLWQGRQYVAVASDISGAERALEQSTIMMMWELHRKTSW